MSEPVVMVVRCVPKPGQREALLEVLREIVPMVHDEEGCELYSINAHEGGELYIIEKWSSPAFSAQHGNSSAVLPILQERATPLLASIPEVIELTPVPIGGPKGAL